MVYCGIPSKACSPCRSKRTKCDLARPSCSQCKRTGRVCGGYRAHSDLQIRDQSQAIAAKSSGVKCKSPDRAVVAGLQSPFAAPKTAFASELQSSRCANVVEFIPARLCLLPEDGAAYFFFNDYVLEDSVTSHSLFDALPRLYSKAPSESAISKTITALGMACLSNAMNMPEVMARAISKYAEALGLTNSALRCPIKAKLDETLMVVILLGLYEENNRTSQSLDPWNNHINGAMALLDFRGEEQLHRPTGLKLISALRTQVIVNSLIRRAPVPEKIIKWSRLARQYEAGEENSESELAEIIAQYCNLQATVGSCNANDDRISILERALDIDIELSDWAAAHQITNLYVIVNVNEPSPEVFWDHWHRYSDLGMAAICNHYRSIRIHVNQMLIVQLSQLSDETYTLDDHNLPFWSTCSNQIEASKRLIIELSHDICASVPYFIGDADQSFDGDFPSNSQRVQTAHGKLLLWPLYVAGQTEYVSDVMRSWVINRMEKLADVGIGKATVLARMLKAGIYTPKVSKEQVPEEAWYNKKFSGD